MGLKPFTNYATFVKAFPAVLVGQGAVCLLMAVDPHPPSVPRMRVFGRAWEAL